MLKIYTVIFLVFISFSSFAQANFDNPYHKRPNAKLLNESNASSDNFTGFSGTGANIDVIFHRVFWRINPDSATKYIRGNVVFGFKTITTNVSSITFDLRSVLAVDSIIFRGTRYTTSPAITRSGNIVTFNLGTTIASTGSVDSFRVYYQGTPPAVSGAAQGYQLNNTTTNPSPSGQRHINTLSESFEDRDWWPCKADMQDKIDSMDIIVSVPWTGADTFWVATNGVLIDSAVAGGNRVFKFKTRYPIASYLVSVCVARMNRYYRNVTLTSGSTVPVTYNILRGRSAGAESTVVSNWDIHNQTLIKFSEKLGDYPFKREKHGFYEGLDGANGMEHQTFSAMTTGSVNSHSTLAHELMHQWFGDKATFSTWADLWLAEGMGMYSSVLAGELVPATGLDPVANLASIRSTAKALTTTPVRLTSFGSSATIWTTNNDRAVYQKGAMVHSMLRLLSGDNLYFQALRNYLDSANGSGYKSANTDSLRVNFERVLNRSLVDFFDDWVVNTGSSSTVVNWNTPSTKVLALQIASQTKYPLSSPVSRYSNVFALRLQAAPSFDTTIAIFNPALDSLALVGNGIGPMAYNILYIPLSFTPTSVTFDSTKTLTGGSTVKLTTLDLNMLDFNVKKNGIVNDAVFVLDANSINSVIVLERSGNGVNFTELATMQLNTNNSQNNKEYYYRDLAPLSGDNYYRVKYKYVDGNYRYSKIIKINSPVSTTSDYFSVINNPVKEVLQLKVLQSELQNQKVSLSILDATGKLINKLNTVINNQLLQVDVKKLSKGSYIIKIENENQLLQSLKFVVL
jgi:hypothetical protein